MSVSRPRSRGARVHPRSCQGDQPWPRASAPSGLVLATESLDGITERGTWLAGRASRARFSRGTPRTPRGRSKASAAWSPASCTVTGACASVARTAHSPSSCTSTSTGAPTSRPSDGTSSYGCSTTWSGWRARVRQRSTWSSTRLGRRDDHADPRTDEADARGGADRLPQLRLVAVQDGQAGEQGPLDRARRVRLRALGLGLLRRRRARDRLHAVRAGAVLPP